MDYNLEYAKIEKEILALKLPKPALRALINADVYTVEKLNSMSLEEIERLHGMGPTSIQKLKTLIATCKWLLFSTDCKYSLNI